MDSARGPSGRTPAVGYTVTVPASVNPAVAVYRNGTFIGNDFPGESLAFTPKTGNVSAFGGCLYPTDSADGFQAQPVTVTATDSLGATLSQTYTPTGACVGSFRGFTTTGVFTSIVLSAPDITTAHDFNSVDNVIAGRAIQATPEPSALAALGLGAVARVKRRKRA